VNEDCLKLTIYYGERDRAEGRFLADALVEVFARHELQTSLVMRGVTGFGIKQHMHTDRLLTISEDLPLVSVAVDTRPRIERASHDLERLTNRGRYPQHAGRGLRARRSRSRRERAGWSVLGGPF
jgi:PII-like signaling protein